MTDIRDEGHLESLVDDVTIATGCAILSTAPTLGPSDGGRGSHLEFIALSGVADLAKLVEFNIDQKVVIVEAREPRSLGLGALDLDERADRGQAEVVERSVRLDDERDVAGAVASVARCRGVTAPRTASCDDDRSGGRVVPLII